MTDEEIHNIYLHMSGKAEGLVEATGKADFPVLFARAILEYDRLTKDVQNMASKSTYKEQLEKKDEPVALVAEVHISRYTIEWTNGPLLQGTKLYTTPQSKTKDEPVAWGMKKDGVILDVICPEEHEREEGEYTIPVYTQPQRTWVWLTKEEINEGLLRSFYVLEKARAWRDGVAWAIQQLKDKNNV